MRLAHTRTMIRAALAGELDRICTHPDSVFGVAVPQHVSGVPDQLLDPRSTWTAPAAYDEQAHKLAALFRRNFEQFADDVPAAVPEAGPKA